MNHTDNYQPQLREYVAQLVYLCVNRVKFLDIESCHFYFEESSTKKRSMLYIETADFFSQTQFSGQNQLTWSYQQYLDGVLIQ